MKKISVKQLVLTAVFAALTFVATFVIRIPIPATGGYVNLGDCVVLISGFLIGPYLGAFAAGIGSAIADIIGYPIYAPATFIIKALIALIAGVLFKFSKKKSTIWIVICSIIGETIMIFGYYVFEAFMLGLGWATAATGIPANIFQAITGITAATLLIQIFVAKKHNSSDIDTFDDEED